MTTPTTTTTTTAVRPSPFFHAGDIADEHSLAILHLKRDSLLPITLGKITEEGYAEGAVTNTRFGSFPHNTLIAAEWGSQVRASKVDTGTRGRRGKSVKPVEPEAPHVREADADADADADGTDEEANTRKRKADEHDQHLADPPSKKTRARKDDRAHNADPSPRAAAVEARSGFVHILPPTPESWTSSLDHRTQVVYTPDYSYILQRLRVRPGDSMMEAGAGSGSFTHAAARALYNGYPADARKTGKLYSFEYHEPRVRTLRDEITEHRLDGIVHLTHRDVCNDGFTLQDGSSPSVEAVFLDLPAPWQALKHLSRSTPNTPLNPDSSIRICTFSPCIEQVMATVTALRKAGWADISMLEVQHKRIDVRRERVGLREEGLRGVNASAASVDESIARLREVEQKITTFHAHKANTTNHSSRQETGQIMKNEKKQDRLDRIKREAEERKLYKEGNLVHRTEPEVKTHTSYLVFAILPREWTDEDEKKCEECYPVEDIMKGSPAKEMKSK